MDFKPDAFDRSPADKQDELKIDFSLKGGP